MGADEDRAGVADLGGERVGVAGLDLEMLRRQTVDERDRVGEARHHDDGAEIAPARAGDVAARQGLELAGERFLDGVGERRAVGDEDRLRRGVVLGLGEEIGGDPVGVRGAVGEDQHLGRAGDHVDPDLAEDPAFCRRHIGVAGPDDLGDAGDRRRPIGERRDRLRAADPVDLVDAGELGCREHQRVRVAARRRRHHDDPRHARDLRRHGVHEDGRRIARGPARHIEPDRGDRRPAPAEADAERVGRGVVLRLLARW